MQARILTGIALVLLWLAPGCGGGSVTPDAGADAERDGAGDAGGGDSGADASDAGADDGGSDPGADASDAGTDGGGVEFDPCPPLGPPAGRVIAVDPSRTAELPVLMAEAEPGDTFSLADGTYDLCGGALWISAAGVALRSASGDRDAVVLDGCYQTTEVVTVAASDVTLADLTIRRAATHGIHVVTTSDSDTLRTLIHNVRVVDPGEQAIKINPGPADRYPDSGQVRCSSLELTDAGRPNVNPTAGGCYTGGVDAHGVVGWVVRDNTIRGFWCPNGLSEHGIHFWRGARDTLIERNRLIDNARGIGLGLDPSGGGRTWPDGTCPGLTGYADHLGGTVRNNFVSVARSELFGSAAGFDCGICLAAACGAEVVHNTVASSGGTPFSGIEWRFEASRSLGIRNNLSTASLLAREGAIAEEEGNLAEAPAGLLQDIPGGDLHLRPDAAAPVDSGVSLSPGLCEEDIDGQWRDVQPDIGADER